VEYDLIPHPDALPHAIRHLSVVVTRQEQSIDLVYVLDGDLDALVVPPPGDPARADNLWQTTCFELFLADADGGYTEFNFSPSTAWAQYQFSAYRIGMQPDADIAVPAIEVRADGDGMLVNVSVPVAPGSPFLHPAAVGLSAVIEERGGAKSYWALVHAPGPPDFHNRDCFIATLPPPTRP